MLIVNVRVVRLRDCNTKQVMFGTVDSTDCVCVCTCPHTMSTVLVNLCLDVDADHVSVSV